MTFWEELKRPFNWLMIAIAFIPGFYFYYFPHNDKGIAYTVEGPSIIYDSKIASPAIRLVDAANTPIKSDTYLQTITIWNTGSSAIEPSDIRRPLSFIFQGAERLLDFKIVSSTDSDVCEFALTNLNVQGNQAVSLNWKHFDPKEAVKFQVIYCQQTKPVTLVSADIVGIRKLQSGVKQKAWSQFVFALFQLCNAIFVIRFVLWDDMRSKKKFAIMFGLLLIISASILVWLMVSPTLFSPTSPNL